MRKRSSAIALASAIARVIAFTAIPGADARMADANVIGAKNDTYQHTDNSSLPLFLGQGWRPLSCRCNADGCGMPGC